jgi:ABC-type branched-subunit amino acid transport system substrate-binding protein
MLIATACGGGADVDDDAGGPGGTSAGNTATPANSKPDYCEGATLDAPEVGVTADTITVTVMADTGSSLRPALFLGSVNGVKAWADWVNAELGGVGCRKVVVKEADSKLSPDDAKNGVATACKDSVAMVGTTALFLNDLSGMEGCKDKAGNVTGLPDIADLQTEVAHQCSDVSFATLPTGSECPYSGTGPRTFKVGQTQYDFYLKQFPDLHGVFVIPKDLPSTIAATMPIFRAENEMGIKSDAEFGKSALDLQTAYTPVIQAIKQNNSNYARNGLDYQGTVLMRKEARNQGVDDQVKVWDCSVQCYDERLISEAQGATEGQYVWLNILPMEDGEGANPTLDAFLKYNKKPDGFGLQAFAAGEIFRRVVDDAIKANGNDPNAVTRVNILEALRNLHDFDAGGMTPKLDIGGKVGSVCLVGMQVQDGKFVRVSPTEPGTFDCGGDKPPIELTIDPAKEYKG